MACWVPPTALPREDQLTQTVPSLACLQARMTHEQDRPSILVRLVCWRRLVQVAAGGARVPRGDVTYLHFASSEREWWPAVVTDRVPGGNAVEWMNSRGGSERMSRPSSAR